MDRSSSRQQQPRSNSISGEEYHLTGNEYRQRFHSNTHNLYPTKGQQQNCQQSGSMVGALVDLNQLTNHGQQVTTNRMHPIPSPYLSGQSGRSPSPGRSLQFPYQTQQHNYYQHQTMDPRHQVLKNHMHASLECLNTAHFNEFQQHQQQQQHNQQIQHLNQLQNNLGVVQQSQQQQLRHQHYATSYVLATPPANTVINKSGDQDLAAAVMGNPPSANQYQSFAPTSSYPQNGPNGLPAQVTNHNSGYCSSSNILTRAINQVSQSPLRKMGLTSLANNSGSNSVTSGGLISHLSSSIASQHPIRAGHSSLSLATSSTLLIEDKLQNEIKKLQCELNSEREKNEALNSQLNINSSLMAAFEQSLTTLNTRLRQLTTLNDKKDNEIEELKEALKSTDMNANHENDANEYSSPGSRHSRDLSDARSPSVSLNGCDKTLEESDSSSDSRQALLEQLEDLKKKLVEKDRQLTDTKLEALSAAHQLEQLESKMNGDTSLLTNEDELDEGVMVANHSPSDSDAVTDSAQLSEMNPNNTDSTNNNHRPTSEQQRYFSQQEDTQAFYNLINNKRSHDNARPNLNKSVGPDVNKDLCNPNDDNRSDIRASEQHSCNSSFTNMSLNSREDVRWVHNQCP